MDVQYKSNNFLHDQKLRILNPESKPNEENNIKYELIDDLIKSNLLGDMNVFLPVFMEMLWKQPNIVAKILLSANNKDISEHLSYFFCHNFYENILSPNYIEYNLLYLITLMLKDEINNVPKKVSSDPYKCLDSFLNNTPSGILLEQFQKKNDVLTFFATILLNIIENLERNSSNREIIFDLNKIENKCKGRAGIPDSRSQSRNLDINMINVANREYLSEFDFFYEYAIDMDKKYFEEKIRKCKENKQIKIMEYFIYHFNIIDSNKKSNCYHSNIFIKKNNMNNLLNQQILDEYITNFDKTINLINDLLKNLIDNLYLLPYSIKCICKIIYSLASKKFKLYNQFQLYAFISKFFFEKLFSPIFQNPALGALINSFIISSQTLKNLEEISKIILMFSSGDFFKNNNKEGENYTPFNSYFVSKIEELFKFYEEITKVELPSFIEKLINDELEENYEYDFFKENKEEVVYHFSACFNTEELNVLLELLDKNKKKVFDVAKGNEDKFGDLIKLKIVFEKLINKNNKEALKKIRNNPEYEIVKIPIYHKKKKEIKEYKEAKGRKIIKYFLISKIILNQDYSKLINFKQEKKFFNLKEINTEETDENNINENMKNKIIKVKNFFCTILYNYRTLVKTDFEEDKISNTINILNELKKLMRCSNNMLIVNFPSQWYVDSLLDYLGKIPDDYKNGDFELLINELQNEINDSIKSMHFEDLSILIDKMKFATRGKNYYDNVINIVLDMKMNKTAQNIVEKENLEIEILFKMNEKKKEFKIYKPSQSSINLQYFDNILAAPIEKGTRVCKSISSFTKHFPHMKKYSEKFKHANLFDFLKGLNVPNQIKEFFKIIKDCLITNYNITDEKELLNIFEKINDYVMEKLYEKIYPTAISDEDEKIFEKCEELKHNEIGYFIKTKNSQSFESFLPELTGYLFQIEKEKSIRKKLFNLKKIFESMNNLSNFNGGKSFDLDTQVQILSYVLVKAQPRNIYTNCQYMELFIGDKGDKIEGQNLMELKLVCQHLLGKKPNNNNK